MNKPKTCEYGPASAASAAGNSAKLREALVEARKVIKAMGGYWAMETLPIIDAALSEPPRNCDKYTSPDEARNAYMAINEMPEGNRDEDMRQWLCDFHHWLLALAKEGGGK